MAATLWKTSSTCRPTSACCKSQPVLVSRPSRQTCVRVSAVHSPHKVLGVTDTADVKEIKRAYRKLALQYHPDICKTEEGHHKFIALTQAYEMLLGRAEGKHDPHHASHSGWDFHDWYWNFRMSRSWEKQQGRAASTSPNRPPPQQQAAGFKREEARDNLRSQLAGLRHRAAVRANRPASPAPPAGAPIEEGEQEQGEQHQQHQEQEQPEVQRPAVVNDNSNSAAAATGTTPTAGRNKADDPQMAVCDGHYATVLNSAVPFPASMKRHSSPPRPWPQQRDAPPAAPTHASGSEHDGQVWQQEEVARATATATAVPQGEEESVQQLYAVPDAPDSDPDGALTTQPPQQQEQQHEWNAGQRRRFVASQERREAVSGQLAGLRRKAAFKSGAAQYV